MAQFAVCGLAATLAIGSMTVAVSRHVGTQQAIEDAKRVTRLAGEGIVAPHIDSAVLDGDPRALRRLDDVVRRRVLHDGIVRVKIWTADSRVVYSDDPGLVGDRFPLGDDERAALRGGSGVGAEVTGSSGAENRSERDAGKILEVYVPIRARSGRPLLFEAYTRFSAVSASGRRLWQAFAPALVGGLLLLLLATLPLGRSLARRLRDGQQAREALLRRSIDASETERRRIAADLHDGVVQDLVGVSYALSVEADRLDRDGTAAASVALRHGAAMARHSVRALRTLLVDIYPPTLHDAGLEAALCDLARTYTARGIETSVDIPAEIALDEPVERLLFRCAQETLRNTHKHASAGAAWLTVCRTGLLVVMEVRDDGRGFDRGATDTAGARRRGHFGLSVLGDLVADAGGGLDIDARPGRGTTVRVAIPG